MRRQEEEMHRTTGMQTGEAKRQNEEAKRQNAEAERENQSRATYLCKALRDG